MRISEKVYWIGSGLLGMNATDELDCNVYLLDGGSEQAIIDCGTGYGLMNIMEELRRDGFDPKSVRYILLTHAHMDHAGGAAAMRELTGARIVASRLSASFLERGDEEAIGLAQAREADVYPSDCRLNACKVDSVVEHGQLMQIGDLTVEVIETPGHSCDMISFFIPYIRTLFCSDNVFVGGRIAAIDTPDFSMDQLFQSLMRLGNLHVDRLMPGHLTPVVRNGIVPIRKAVDQFMCGSIPESIV